MQRLLAVNDTGTYNQIFDFINDLSPAIARRYLFSVLAERIVDILGERKTLKLPRMLADIFHVEVSADDPRRDAPAGEDWDWAIRPYPGAGVSVYLNRGHSKHAYPLNSGWRHVR